MSHFEPAHARKVFPCFDEPSFKASFTISITHDPQYYALSNMPRARLVTRKDGLVEEHFAPSVNMSSYLVAFAVVDFKYKEKMTSSRVLVWLSLLFVEYNVCFIGGFPVRSFFFFFLRRLFSSITKLRFRDGSVRTVRLIVEIKKSLQRSVDGASDDGRKN